MRSYILTPSARRDLNEIWNYTAQQWSTEQAEQYVGDLRHAIEVLRDHPRLGRSYDDIKRGYFRVLVGSHAIFYRIEDDIIVVVRVLHQKMDFSRRL